MKRLTINTLFAVFLLLMFIACNEPEPEFEGTWLETLIYHAENGTDTTHTQAIFAYEYRGEPVYYTLSFGGVYVNCVYDTLGIKLGAPDGGWCHNGDGTLQDFFVTAIGGSMIWHYDFPVVKGVDDEYMIYNAALSFKFPDETFLHLQSPTLGESEQFYYLDELDAIDYDTLMITDYLTRNMIAINPDTTQMIDPVQTVNQALLDSIWNAFDYPSDWQYYYRQYPESCGIVTLSRPGFSSDGTTAVLKLGWQFSGDGGQGYLLVLKKYDDHWLVKDTFYTWVS